MVFIEKDVLYNIISCMIPNGNYGNKFLHTDKWQFIVKNIPCKNFLHAAKVIVNNIDLIQLFRKILKINS